MQRIPFGSPARENIIPAQQSPLKKGKYGTLLELISFIKTTGVNLPPSIARIISSGINPQSPTKPFTNRENFDDPKKLKIQLSDIQFQYKKLQQDFAEFKRFTKSQRQRDVKKYEDIINRLKSALQNSNQDGTYNIQKLQKTHTEEISQFKEKSKLELQQEIAKIYHELQAKIDSQDKLHKREMAELQKNQQKQYNQKVKYFQDQIVSVRATHTKQLKEMQMRHKHIIEDKERRHDSVRLALESERRTEEKLHEKTKIEFSKEKEKLITQLCYQKNVNLNSNEQIQNLQKEITRLKNVIKDKDIDLQLLQQKRKKQLTQHQRSYQQKIESHQKLQVQQIVDLKKQHSAELQSLEQRLLKIQNIQREKEELMTANIEDLSACYQRRPSKREDISELQKMKWALAKKDEQNRKLIRDLKHCNLELQNKQEMYTRIFRGNSMSRDKKNRQKDDKEQIFIDQKLLKEPLFRKSQTSDVKFLLKMYNNTKNP